MKVPPILLTFVVGSFAVAVSAQGRDSFEISGGVSGFSLGDSSGRLCPTAGTLVSGLAFTQNQHRSRVEPLRQRQ